MLTFRAPIPQLPIMTTWISLISIGVCFAALKAVQADEVLTNHFLVKVHGGHEAAHRIAKRHGFVNLGPVGLTVVRARNLKDWGGFDFFRGTETLKWLLQR